MRTGEASSKGVRLYGLLADGFSPAAAFLYEGISKSIVPAAVLWAYILSEGKNTPSPWHPRGCGLGLLIWMGLILVTTPLQALASVGVCRSLDVKGQLMCEAVLPWLVPTAVCVLGGFAFAWSRARDSRP